MLKLQKLKLPVSLLYSRYLWSRRSCVYIICKVIYGTPKIQVKIMNFIFKPTLQHIAVVKIVTFMWMEDIKDTKGLFSRSNIVQERGWIEVENKIMEKVKGMRRIFPENVRNKLLGAIKPIGDEILLWMEYLRKFVTHLDISVFQRNLRNLCWTSQGTLDLIKTVEIWIRDEALDVFPKYELACVYSIENEISNLYDQMCETDKEYLDDEYVMRENNSKLVVHWTCRLIGASSRKRRRSEFSQYKYAFLHAVLEGNKVATKYFFEKLSPEEKDEYIVPETTDCIIRSFSVSGSMQHRIHYFAEISCFLLSKMNEEQQMKVFESCPYGVLRSLLVWLKQSFFLETANRMLSYITARDYCRLLFLDILTKIDKDYKDYDYHELYAKLWQQTPGHIKKYVFNETNWFHILFYRINVKGQEWMLMKWILKEGTAEEKSNLILSPNGTFLCENLIIGEHWHFLELFMKECISSVDGLTIFKDRIKVYLEFLGNFKFFSETEEIRQKLRKAEIEEKLGVIYSLIESKLVT